MGIDFIDLGRLDFLSSYIIQRQLVEKRITCEIGDKIIFVEHESCFTIGRTASSEDIEDCQLAAIDHSIPMYHTDRGGGITYHGPGQIVMYPIINLRERQLDLINYLRKLETIALKFLSFYNIRAFRKEALRGGWTEKGKVASIGIGVSHWVSYHGMSLNINCNLGYFSLIRPCGLDSKNITSLEGLGITTWLSDTKGILKSISMEEFSVGDTRLEAAASLA